MSHATSPPRVIQVEVQPYRVLRIYNPYGLQQPIIRGRTILIGDVVDIDGTAWLQFRFQRGFGVPLDDDGTERMDLKLAESYGDVKTQELTSVREEQ